MYIIIILIIILIINNFNYFIWINYHSFKGIVPRSIYDLFQRLEEKDSDKFKYRVFVTFLELYNEDLTDLLHPESSNNYQIREDPWLGIKEEEVESPEELLRYVKKINGIYKEM